MGETCHRCGLAINGDDRVTDDGAHEDCVVALGLEIRRLQQAITNLCIETETSPTYVWPRGAR